MAKDTKELDDTKGVWASTKRAFSEIWLAKIFEAEFGYSDLLSNYSRTYAWMANQLGHMTLGLVTMLFLMWAAESVSEGIHLLHGVDVYSIEISSADGVGAGLVFVLILLAYFAATGGALAPGATFAICVVFAASVAAHSTDWLPLRAPTLALLAVLCLAVPVVTAIFLFLTFGRIRKAVEAARAVRAAEEREKLGAPLDGDEALLAGRDLSGLTGIYKLQETYWTSSIALGMIAAFAVFGGYFAIQIWLATGDNRIIGVIAALSLAGAVVVNLSEDGRFALVGAMATYTAAGFVLHADAATLAQLLDASIDDIHHLGYLGAGANAVMTAIAFWRGPALDWGFYARIVGAAFLIAAVIILIFRSPPTDATMVALGFAIASMAVWAAKEFGSDMPKVRLEIEAARKARIAEVLPKIDTDMERDYAKHGVRDTVTDASFYAAGAYIGIGFPVDPWFILHNEAELIGLGWASEIEIVGAVIFILIFLALGRNWAYRQEAVDLTGSFRANRLALFWGWLEVRGAGKPLNLRALQEFAKGETCLEAKSPNLDLLSKGVKHLIVIGPSGGGRSPLGAAIATEAALCDLRSEPFHTPPPRRGSAAQQGRVRRTARYLKMSTLRWTHDNARPRSELLYTPTRDFYFVEAKGEAEKSAAFRRIMPKTEQNPMGGADLAIGRADVVVLDDCNGRKEDFEAVIDRLHPAGCGRDAADEPKGQLTVWMVAAEPGSSPEEIGFIKECLASRGVKDKHVATIDLLSKGDREARAKRREETGHAD